MRVMLVRAVAALLVAHVLPGLLAVNVFSLGRSRFDRFVMAAVLGGPMAAAVYWVSLVTGRSWSYALLLAIVDLAAVASVVLARRRAPDTARSSRREIVLLGVWATLVATTYFLTTGVLFAPDAAGNLVLDPSLQRDTLFHVGLVRSLESSYPPELLSVSGETARYHAGYHLQLAAWSRFFGIDPFDGVYRVGPVWSLVLLVLSTYAFGLRFHASPRRALVTAVLIFGAGLGFVFAGAPGADWWSLVFMDVALVSIFLVNPFLPALPLLFVGLSNLDDRSKGAGFGALLASSLAFAALLTTKVFLGAQILLALAIALLGARRNERRDGVVIGLFCLPFILATLFSAGESNTSVGVRPLEIVRYSTEKLGWENASRLLADVGSGRVDASSLVASLGLTVFWLSGFLGLRLFGAARVLVDLRGSFVRRVAATFVAIGFPLALLVRIAPAEATGLSRVEAINDVLWLSTQSGILLWFWTTEVLARLPWRPSVLALLALTAFPSTVQHFFYHASLPPDVVPAREVEAARAAARVSRPGDVWVEPPDRKHPSVVAYMAGRPVVYDGYVGYDYMFVPRSELDERRHALAQFWQTEDPGYAAWFLSLYDVRFIHGAEEGRVPQVATPWTEPLAPFIYSVSRDLPRLPVRAPDSIPLGLGGAAFFGSGWGPPSGSPRTREIQPGVAILYLPLPGDSDVRVAVVGSTADGRETGFEVVLPASKTRPGLNRVEVIWKGPSPLRVQGVRVRPYP